MGPALSHRPRAFTQLHDTTAAAPARSIRTAAVRTARYQPRRLPLLLVFLHQLPPPHFAAGPPTPALAAQHSTAQPCLAHCPRIPQRRRRQQRKLGEYQVDAHAAPVVVSGTCADQHLPVSYNVGLCTCLGSAKQQLPRWLPRHISDTGTSPCRAQLIERLLHDIVVDVLHRIPSL